MRQKNSERVSDSIGYALAVFKTCRNSILERCGSVHHQFAAGIAERRFELAGVKTWLAEISTVQHDMVFT